MKDNDIFKITEKDGWAYVLKGGKVIAYWRLLTDTEKEEIDKRERKYWYGDEDFIA